MGIETSSAVLLQAELLELAHFDGPGQGVVVDRLDKVVVRLQLCSFRTVL